MKPYSLPVFFILSLAASLLPQYTVARRFLHHPLPVLPSISPPPRQDHPFFRQQAQQSPPPPPPPPSVDGGIQPVEATNETPSRGKKIAIALSSGILTLALVSALAIYLCKHCGNLPDESRKLVAGNSVDQDSRMPPPAFLHFGALEPSYRSFVEGSGNGANASPYRKLMSVRRSERYRPSPDLQPLPPLPWRPPLPRTFNFQSPPPTTLSEDDDHGSPDTDFYTPQGSSISDESSISRRSYLSRTRSKRNSPKSRISASSPSLKQPSPPPLLPVTSRWYIPKTANIAAPPPPSDMARFRLINGDDHQKPKPPNPPPPPPPPPPAGQLTNSRKVGTHERRKPSLISNQSKNPQPESFSPQKYSVNEEEDKQFDSSERHESKPRLKPLHWDKVKATSDRATVWDQLNSNSFPLNEDAMESLFGCNSSTSSVEPSRKPAPPATTVESRVLDPKKSQNIAILLRAFNVTIEDVSEALLDGNPEGLGADLLETLVKMAPTKEEEIKLKQYNGDIARLGSAERFLKAILDVPFAFKRVDTLLYRANFETEVAYLRKSFRTLEAASEELKNSRLFLKLLEAVLRTGNRMNDGTKRGDAKAFKLDTLLKLADVKGTDGKTTLLHFVVQEIIRSEGASPNANKSEFKKRGLQVISSLSQELINVKNAAGMDADVLSSYVTKLETGLKKAKLVVQHENQSGRRGKFFDSMEESVNEAGEEIIRVKDEERRALSVVKEATEYFHGDAAKEEAHPLRIFMIVRDFLAILDSVCKDIGRMQINAMTMMSNGRSFRMAQRSMRGIDRSPK